MQLKYKIKSITYSVIRTLYKALFIFPVRENKVIVNVYDSMGYYDNPKYIADEMLKMKDMEIYCITKDDAVPLPPYVKRVKKRTLSYLYHYATSKIAISNTRFPIYVVKRKGQYFVGTWHGVAPGKRVGLSMKGLTPSGRALVLNDAKVVDLFVSGGKFLTNVYRTDFGYEGDIIEAGYPRADAVFKDDDNSRLYKELGIDKEKKICMYAPTFRKSGDMSVYDIDYERLKKALEKRFGGDWVILVRFHPNMSGYAGSLGYNDWLIDATKVQDLYSMYRIIDLMITDYSSAGYEYFVYTGKPLLLYAKDIEEYREERDTYIDICNYPFPLAKNNDELIDIIENGDVISEKSKAYLETAGVFINKDSSKEVAEYVLLKAFEKGAGQ